MGWMAWFVGASAVPTPHPPHCCPSFYFLVTSFQKGEDPQSLRESEVPYKGEEGPVAFRPRHWSDAVYCRGRGPAVALVGAAVCTNGSDAVNTRTSVKT